MQLKALLWSALLFPKDTLNTNDYLRDTMELIITFHLTKTANINEEFLVFPISQDTTSGVLISL